MTSRAEPSALLLRHQALLATADRALPVLDLACGDGRNGLALAAQGHHVAFADLSEHALKSVRKSLSAAGLEGETWQVDLEQEGIDPFAGRQFAAVICFRYLHRPLFPALRRTIADGGLVIYETFTTEQPRYGHPHNPEFLLRPGELAACFPNWEIIHYFEGVQPNPERSVAQLVARKPPGWPGRPRRG
ncbi:MAG: class I SAM-dependent methyltransferase [Lysobacterales bacterium]